MRASNRRYRQEVYRLRSHPHDEIPPAFIDRRDSNLGLYLSLIPFLALEYVAELSLTSIPTGILFPLGYLLFWAFYFTYYKPGILEENLTSPKSWNAWSIPALVIGVVVWFLKVSVVELSHLIFVKFLSPVPTKRPPRGTTYEFKRPAEARSQGSYHHHQRPRTPPPAATTSKPKPTLPALPQDLLAALLTLGLTNECRDWKVIHHRFRELAKKYHPDLNRDITTAGKRFIIYDGAYKKLYSAKDKFFA